MILSPSIWQLLEISLRSLPKKKDPSLLSKIEGNSPDQGSPTLAYFAYCARSAFAVLDTFVARAFARVPINHCPRGCLRRNRPPPPQTRVRETPFPTLPSVTRVHVQRSSAVNRVSNYLNNRRRPLCRPF